MIAVINEIQNIENPINKNTTTSLFNYIRLDVGCQSKYIRIHKNDVCTTKSIWKLPTLFGDGLSPEKRADYDENYKY